RRRRARLPRARPLRCACSSRALKSQEIFREVGVLTALRNLRSSARKRGPRAADCGLWAPSISAFTRVFDALCAGVSGSLTGSAFTGSALWLVSSAVTTEINATECLAAAGLPASEVKAWLQAEPGETTDFPSDREEFSEYWRTSARLLGGLPRKGPPNPREQDAAPQV